eukprot:1149543-Pelagomonas_calceolata.AAC.5
MNKTQTKIRYPLSQTKQRYMVRQARQTACKGGKHDGMKPLLDIAQLSKNKGYLREMYSSRTPATNKFTQLRTNHAGALVLISTQGFSECNECPEMIQDAVV